MLFQLEGIVKRYGAITALSELSAGAPDGAVGLLGPNGAGKTTMIRCLLGLVRIQEGRGEVLGMDIRTHQREIRQAVGFMPEDDCLFPETTGVEFVSYAGELCGMPRKDAIQRAHEVLDYAELEEQRYRKVESYSTGMRQRLKLASAIVHDPKLLILDEPTNGLDPPGREKMVALARDLSRAKGMNILFSSHLLPDVESVCDHVLVLGGGKLLASGRIEELKRGAEGRFEVRTKANPDRFAGALAARGCAVEPAEDSLLIQLPAGAGVDLIWAVAREGRFQVRLLKPRHSTLEDIFLRAVAGRN